MALKLKPFSVCIVLLWKVWCSSCMDRFIFLSCLNSVHPVHIIKYIYIYNVFSCTMEESYMHLEYLKRWQCSTADYCGYVRIFIWSFLLHFMQCYRVGFSGQYCYYILSTRLNNHSCFSQMLFYHYGSVNVSLPVFKLFCFNSPTMKDFNLPLISI